MFIPDKDQDPEAFARLRLKVFADISERERVYMRHVCDPKLFTNDQIADLMGVAADTVDGYLKSLRNKFSITSKVGVVIFVMLWGLHGLLCA